MADLCSFLCRGVARNSKVTDPACLLQYQKLPKSTQEAEYRMQLGEQAKRNTTEGLSGRYDQWGNNPSKRKCLETITMFSMECKAVADFFKEKC